MGLDLITRQAACFSTLWIKDANVETGMGESSGI